MKINKTLLTLSFLIFILFIAGCGSQESLCKSPYIEYQKGTCCLDEDKNGICDRDKAPVEDVYEVTYFDGAKEIPPGYRGIIIVGQGVYDLKELYVEKGFRLTGTIESNEPINILMSEKTWGCYRFMEKGFDKAARYDSTGENIYASLFPIDIEVNNVLNYNFDFPPKENTGYCLIVWRDDRKSTSAIIKVNIKGTRKV